MSAKPTLRIAYAVRRLNTIAPIVAHVKVAKSNKLDIQSAFKVSAIPAATCAF